MRTHEHPSLTRRHRLYREEGLSVRKRRARRKACGVRVPILVEERPNARWSLDFVYDQFANGRRFRVLNVADDVTKECLGATPDTSISGRRVARELRRYWHDAADQARSSPATAPSSPAMRSWPGARTTPSTGTSLRRGKPIEDTFVESFNGRMRDEFLNETLFFRFDDARNKLAEWVADYNGEHPHSSLKYQTPAAYAAAFTATDDRLRNPGQLRRSPVAPTAPAGVQTLRL
jgi:putative transposase